MVCLLNFLKEIGKHQGCGALYTDRPVSCEQPGVPLQNEAYPTEVSLHPWSAERWDSISEEDSRCWESRRHASSPRRNWGCVLRQLDSTNSRVGAPVVRIRRIAKKKNTHCAGIWNSQSISCDPYNLLGWARGYYGSSHMHSLIARGHETNIWDDVWIKGTVLSRSGAMGKPGNIQEPQGLRRICLGTSNARVCLGSPTLCSIDRRIPHWVVRKGDGFLHFSFFHLNTEVSYLLTDEPALDRDEAYLSFSYSGPFFSDISSLT